MGLFSLIGNLGKWFWNWTWERTFNLLKILGVFFLFIISWIFAILGVAVLYLLSKRVYLYKLLGRGWLALKIFIRGEKERDIIIKAR